MSERMSAERFRLAEASDPACPMHAELYAEARRAREAEAFLIRGVEADEYLRAARAENKRLRAENERLYAELDAQTAETVRLAKALDEIADRPHNFSSCYYVARAKNPFPCACHVAIAAAARGKK